MPHACRAKGGRDIVQQACGAAYLELGGHGLWRGVVHAAIEPVEGRACKAGGTKHLCHAGCRAARGGKLSLRPVRRIIPDGLHVCMSAASGAVAVRPKGVGMCCCVCACAACCLSVLTEPQNLRRSRMHKVRSQKIVAAAACVVPHVRTAAPQLT